MYRILIVMGTLLLVECSQAQETDFKNFQGKWVRLAQQNDPLAKKATMEFFLKASESGNQYPYLLLRTEWTENGVPKKSEIIKACHFHKQDKETYFSLSLNPVSAEPTPWFKYQWVGEKVEIQAIPSVVSQTLNLSGTYQRLSGKAEGDGFTALFPEEGVPKGWLVREWNDLAKAVPAENAWTVKDGVLQPGKKRGTWLVSEKEYADFILEFEIKLTEVGNSGLALRAPLKGDPAFEGMELQFADLRYNLTAKPNELTGAIYRAIAPTKQVYKPVAWNACRVELKGDQLKVTLNGEVIQNVDLSKFDQPTKRHDGSNAPPLKDRPKKGHLGFQHLSRNNEPIFLRGVKLQEWKEPGGKGDK